MKKVLFVSFNHNVSDLADSIQNRRLVTELSKLASIDILMRDYGKKNEGGNCIKVWSPNLYYFDILLYKIFPFLRPVFSIDCLVWVLFAKLSMLKVNKEYDDIIITFEPYGINRILPFLKKKFQSKIIVFFYDPLANNPFFNKSSLGYKLQIKLEDYIGNVSDIIFANTPQEKSYLEKRVNCKIVFLPLCAPIIHKKTLLRTNKLIFAHSGSLHGLRRLEELNRTVTILKGMNGNQQLNLEFAFFGRVTKEKRVCVDEAGNNDLIKFYGYLSQDELSDVLSNASALLLIDPISVEKYPGFPSKLCEYFQYKKPIFAFCSKNSPADELLKKTHNISCNIGEEEIMAKAIDAFIRDSEAFCSKITDVSDCFKPIRIASSVLKYL